MLRDFLAGGLEKGREQSSGRTSLYVVKVPPEVNSPMVNAVLVEWSSVTAERGAGGRGSRAKGAAPFANRLMTRQNESPIAGAVSWNRTGDDLRDEHFPFFVGEVGFKDWGGIGVIEDGGHEGEFENLSVHRAKTRQNAVSQLNGL